MASFIDISRVSVKETEADDKNEITIEAWETLYAWYKGIRVNF